MKDKLNNIFNLSKLFIRENDVNLKIINMETKKINKKSVLFWIYVVLFFGIFYISSEVISYMVKIGKPEIFINGFLLYVIINFKNSKSKPLIFFSSLTPIIFTFEIYST